LKDKTRNSTLCSLFERKPNRQWYDFTASDKSKTPSTCFLLVGRPRHFQVLLANIFRYQGEVVHALWIKNRSGAQLEEKGVWYQSMVVERSYNIDKRVAWLGSIRRLK